MTWQIRSILLRKTPWCVTCSDPHPPGRQRRMIRNEGWRFLLNTPLDGGCWQSVQGTLQEADCGCTPRFFILELSHNLHTGKWMKYSFCVSHQFNLDSWKLNFFLQVHVNTDTAKFYTHESPLAHVGVKCVSFSLVNSVSNPPCKLTRAPRVTAQAAASK